MPIEVLHLQPPRGYFNFIFLIDFSTPRRRGAQDETFFEKLNSTFISVIAPCIRHTLKQWSTGEYVPPSKSEEFKWETAYSK